MSTKSKAAALLGAAGGRAGKGKSKVRGDAEYYRKLVAKRKSRKKAADNQGERK